MAAKTTDVVRFSDQELQLYERYRRKQHFARKGARAGEEAKKLKTELVEAFGQATIAELPDGRRIQKVYRSGHRKASAAYDYDWYEVAEIR